MEKASFFSGENKANERTLGEKVERVISKKALEIER